MGRGARTVRTEPGLVLAASPQVTPTRPICYQITSLWDRFKGFSIFPLFYLFFFLLLFFFFFFFSFFLSLLFPPPFPFFKRTAFQRQEPGLKRSPAQALCGHLVGQLHCGREKGSCKERKKKTKRRLLPFGTVAAGSGGDRFGSL